jgi:glutamine cyclotransferase
MRGKTVILTLAVVLAVLTNGDQSPRALAARVGRANAAIAQPAAPPETVWPAAVSETPAVLHYSYEVVNEFPHDRNAFTQGLVFLNGAFLESTGLYGQSSLREVELKTGRVLRRKAVPAQYFAEGLAVLGGNLYQLTWRAGKAFVYDLKTFGLEKELSYQGEGWGLTTDGRALIMSDGTSQIRFLDPDTFKVKRTIKALVQGQPLNNLNELEWVKGEIFANIWQTDYVARINPATGRVAGMIDFTGLLDARNRDANTDVLNGIAYDSGADRLFVTGKCWPKLFEVRLKLERP